LVALLVALTASVFCVTGSAAAATRTAASKPAAQASPFPLPITGSFSLPGNKGTGTIQGFFTPQQFTTDKSGAIVLAGTLSGTATDTNGKKVKQFNNVPVQLPFSLTGSDTSTSQPGTTNGNSNARPAALAAVACPILNLVLGPLNLNLLGLQVTLNQVILNINAIPGAGNLLGNLLCDVANLLNTPGLSTSALTDLLNGILGLLSTL
jgi:hypothetical protein